MTKAQAQIARKRVSIKRGLDFLYRVANSKEGFDSYGSLLVCCFALIGATSREQDLREQVRSRARRLVQRWRVEHPLLPTDAGPDELLRFALVSYAVDRLGLHDNQLKAQLRTAVKRFSAQALLGFDPIVEPPPSDLSFACECGRENERGRTFCKQCRKRLQVRSRYRVWMGAQVKTYLGERCGALFGARYAHVLKWLPVMRPYPSPADEDVELSRDAAYGVTHLVYTLNNFSTYRLSPRLLSPEFAFLKSHVIAACEREDPELLGELLDSLKAFGLPGTHPLIVRGTEYLLETQNEDGSWGDPDEENVRTRCHTTWTAIDGLRTHAWRGERPLSPELKSILRQETNQIQRRAWRSLFVIFRVTS